MQEKSISAGDGKRRGRVSRRQQREKGRPFKHMSSSDELKAKGTKKGKNSLHDDITLFRSGKADAESQAGLRDDHEKNHCVS